MIHLMLQKPFKSIKRLQATCLPSLTILTGVNGAGKTHLLEAIKDGSVDAGYPKESIILINYNDMFKILKGNSSSLTPEQIAAVVSIPSEIIELSRSIESELNNLRNGNADDLMPEYLQRIKQQLNKEGVKYSYHDIIMHISSATGKPIHDLTIFDSENVNQPADSNDNPFMLSLEAIFRSYKISQFHWALNRHTEGNRLTFKENLLEYEKIYSPPWKLFEHAIESIQSVSETSDAIKTSFRLTESCIMSQYNMEYYAVKVHFINNAGDVVDFDQLSSGEKTAMALMTLIYKSNDRKIKNQLILLDEIDAFLHPEIIPALPNIINKAFIESESCVIMVSHSASLVAFAPENSTFALSRENDAHLLSPVSKEEAISQLSSGYITLSEGIKVKSKLKENLNIISEGCNYKILEKVLELNGINGINFVRGLRSKTGMEQLGYYYDFILEFDDKPILFVWDCDAKRIAQQRFEGSNTFIFSFEFNPDNSFVNKGIENLLPPEMMEEFCEIEGTGMRMYFHGSNKRKLEEKFIRNATVADTVKFTSFLDKVRAIIPNKGS